MNEYIKREAIKTAWLKVAQNITKRADDEERDALKRYTQRVWDCGVLVERLSEEGKEAVWGIVQRRNSERAGALMVYEKLCDLPAADVAPVVHARWIEKIYEYSAPDYDPLFRRRFYCSECGEWQSYGETAYCPHCGAKMDKEADE